MSRRALIKAAAIAPVIRILWPRSGRVRCPPDRHPYRRGPPRLRGLHLSRAVHVRRTLGLRRHAPERRRPGAHRKREGGLGLRVDAARQCLVVPQRAVRCLARSDAGAGRRSAPHHRRLHGAWASCRSGPCARSGVPARRGRGQPHPVAAGVDSEALHAGRREPVRCGASRRIRQGVRRQRLRDLHARVHERRLVARPRAGVQGRVSRSLRAGKSPDRRCRCFIRSAPAIRSSRPT